MEVIEENYQNYIYHRLIDLLHFQPSAISTYQYTNFSYIIIFISYSSKLKCANFYASFDTFWLLHEELSIIKEV